MEFATGALSTLLPKLGGLLLEEYDLHKGLKKKIKDLRHELLIIEAALLKVSDVPLDQIDPMVKIWANDVRELSYAIEDSLDSFMVRVEGVEPTKPHTFFEFIKKTCKKVTKLKIRREIANGIKDVHIQVKKVKDRYDGYIHVMGNADAKTEVDPRLMAMYSKVSDLVGIDKAIDELITVLFEHNDVPNSKLKTISVVGFGGLGKTTLAKVVYDKLINQFTCGGFVPVGQNPDKKKVLRDILHELDGQRYMNITASQMDARQLMDEVRGFLVNKRYLIVIDDIWDVPTWEMIKHALVDSSFESRVIVTTRNVEVAKRVGSMYNMKPLSDADSTCLFYTRTSGAEGVSSDNHPVDEVTNKILKKCGGVPLAIITIASLLVGKLSEDWSKVYDAIGFGHEDNEVVQNTRKILSFSYYDLPSNLKACLLYLYMFREDSFIEKRSLIWRWVSEGFVPDREGLGFYELGEIYFTELVNKCMIQWIEPGKYGENIGGCRVHDMVLDLIRTISKDVNFVTVDGMEQHNTCSEGKRTHRVRRLALHGRSMEHKCSIEMEHIRSFNAIMCVHTKMPMLLSFKVLRVLVVEGVFLEDNGLEHLGHLVQLRYLGLVNTSVKLPEGIGHDLKFLEILDVRGGSISELPASVGELTKLRCLWADGGTIMKGNVGKMTCLEDLQLNSVEKCPNFFTELGKLTNMRVLKIHFDEWEEIAGKALAESLCNLHKIQSLTIFREGVNKIMDLYKRELHVRISSLEELAPSSRLRFFSLYNIIIPRMPSWILRVPLLSELWLYVEVVEVWDLQTLGRLSSLVVLMLESQENKFISYTFGSDEFPKLYCLMTNIEITLGEGALPMLEVLSYSVSAGKKDSLVPWNNSCPLLKEVTCRLDCANSGNKEVYAAEEILSNAADKTHLDSCILGLDIERENYDGITSTLIDELELILHCLDRPDEQDSNIYEDELLDMIRSLETLLCDAVEPRVGRYGELEIRGFITTFKSLLHDYEQDLTICNNNWYQKEEETDNGDHQEGTSQP